MFSVFGISSLAKLFATSRLLGWLPTVFLPSWLKFGLIGFVVSILLLFSAFQYGRLTERWDRNAKLKQIEVLLTENSRLLNQRKVAEQQRDLAEEKANDATIINLPDRDADLFSSDWLSGLEALR